MKQWTASSRQNAAVAWDQSFDLVWPVEAFQKEVSVALSVWLVQVVFS